MEEFIKLAVEASEQCVHAPAGNICTGCIVYAIQKAVNAERERCAKVAESFCEEPERCDGPCRPKWIADLIRRF